MGSNPAVVTFIYPTKYFMSLPSTLVQTSRRDLMKFNDSTRVDSAYQRNCNPRIKSEEDPCGKAFVRSIVPLNHLVGAD